MVGRTAVLVGRLIMFALGSLLLLGRLVTRRLRLRGRLVLLVRDMGAVIRVVMFVLATGLLVVPRLVCLFSYLMSVVDLLFGEGRRKNGQINIELVGEFTYVWFWLKICEIVIRKGWWSIGTSWVYW